MFVNKGEIIEAFVGQELLAYSDPIRKSTLFYRHKLTKGSNAEVDYLTHLKEQIIPIEVKAGTSTRLKSMNIFLESHQRSSYGLRFWAGYEGKEQAIHSYPLYAVAKPFLAHNDDLQGAVLFLLEAEK